MSIENGLILAATAARGMRSSSEISVAFSVLVAFIVIGVFLFRIRERFDFRELEALDEFARAAVNTYSPNSIEHYAVLFIPR